MIKLALAFFLAAASALSAQGKTPDFYDLDTVREIRLYFKQSN